MQVPSLNPNKSPDPDSPSLPRRRFGIAAFAALSVFLFSGATAPVQCTGHIGPTTGEVVGAAVGVGAVIAIVVVVAVNSGHHTVSGCVISGPNGLELQTSDKRYALEGDAASIKVGDRVKIHGSRVKKTKDTTGDQIYRVENLKKDYGPCPVKVSAPGPSAP